MRNHLHGIDHSLVLVRELDRARETFTRLGFTVAPLGRHGAEMGTGNHIVVFDEDYIELLGVLTPSEFNQMFRDALRVREGIAAAALRTDDVIAAAAEMSAAGVPMSLPMTVRRSVSTADGDTEAAFRITRFVNVTGYLELFYTAPENRQHTWIPSLMTHPNTAWGIDSVVVTADEPESMAADVAGVFGTQPRRTGDGAVMVPVAGNSIVYLSRDALLARYPGIDTYPGGDMDPGGDAVSPAGPAMLWVKVDDLDAAARWLRESDVPLYATDDGLVVPAREACGVMLGLRAAARPGRATHSAPPPA
ncbi:MAG TPA: VOC family protein [Trebonia sp.]|jgi:hypothetical protein|nr:VOC family protein [Trebonia sp.]